MRAIVLQAEAYPVLHVDTETDTSGWPDDDVFDVPDELVARLEAAQKELAEAEKAIHEAIGWPWP